MKYWQYKCIQKSYSKFLNYMFQPCEWDLSVWLTHEQMVTSIVNVYNQEQCCRRVVQNLKELDRLKADAERWIEKVPWISNLWFLNACFLITLFIYSYIIFIYSYIFHIYSYIIFILHYTGSYGKLRSSGVYFKLFQILRHPGRPLHCCLIIPRGCSVLIYFHVVGNN